MPIHDWSRVEANLFHAFHFKWISELSDSLNLQSLPPEFYAVPEQMTAGYEADVLTLKLAEVSDDSITGGLAVATAPPQTAIVSCVEEDHYAKKANRLTIRHRDGDVVAVIEIVSPGNKSTKVAFSCFVEKAAEFIRHGVHFLVIDLLPPGRRDPLGVHRAIWDEFREEPFDFPPGKNRILASYDAGRPWVAYVEPFGVGDNLKAMPLFLKHELYVRTPLEESYQAAWSKFPKPLRAKVESLQKPER